MFILLYKKDGIIYYIKTLPSTLVNPEHKTWCQKCYSGNIIVILKLLIHVHLSVTNITCVVQQNGVRWKIDTTRQKKISLRTGVDGKKSSVLKCRWLWKKTNFRNFSFSSILSEMMAERVTTHYVLRKKKRTELLNWRLMLLTIIVVLKKNETVQLFRFYTRKHETDETIETYITEL